MSFVTSNKSSNSSFVMLLSPNTNLCNVSFARERFVCFSSSTLNNKRQVRFSKMAVCNLRPQFLKQSQNISACKFPPTKCWLNILVNFLTGVYACGGGGAAAHQFTHLKVLDVAEFTGKIVFHFSPEGSSRFVSHGCIVLSLGPTYSWGILCTLEIWGGWRTPLFKI